MTIVSLSMLPAAQTIPAHWHAHLAPTTLCLLYASLHAKVLLAPMFQVVLRM
jgi:hypothetical protein